MKTKIILTTVLSVGIFWLNSMAQQPKLKLSKKFIQSNLQDAAKQIKYLESQVKEADIPTTYENGKHVNFGTGWWCSGFYPGTTLYLYEATGDKKFLEIAKSKLKYLEKEKNNTWTHDLGFMLFCSFGNALRLTGDSTTYVPILQTGAASLSSRYNSTTQTIRSWDFKPWTYPVIIDNMMNLEFLTQAAKITGNTTYAEIAKSHANTTLKNHFRKDNSSYHVIDYNPLDGSIIAKKTAQGAFDESAWARGQAWGLYGYTVMYRETKDKKYLTQAQNIARFYLNHPNLPSDLIPYWDFDQDKVSPDSKFYSRRELRDASTAAIVASALLELSSYTQGKERKTYISKAETMLKSLSKEPYKAAYRSNGGFILKHSVGALPSNGEVDVPLTYADYYYVEALIRYQRMLNKETIIKQ